MRLTMLVALCLGVVVLAAPRTIVEKTVKADTAITIKMDTIRTITYDTIKIVKTLHDTSIVKKIDTIRTKSKPVQVK